MSEKENERIELLNKKVDNLEQRVEQIYTAISGDQSLGLKGLVETMNDHLIQSKKNTEALLAEFKNFKRDLALDYAQDFNSVNERIKPLEEAKNKQAQTLGIFGGVMLVFGYFISNIRGFFKLFTE